jgi:hypothetical protein
MDKKFFVVTDERCGGTSFVSLFGSCSLKVIHDPQTRTNSRKQFENYHKKNRTNLLLDYCYNYLNLNVVKCCYISYSIEEYRRV